MAKRRTPAKSSAKSKAKAKSPARAKTKVAAKPKAKKAARRRRSWLGFFAYWLAVACVWAVILGAGLVAYYAADLPDYDGLLDARVAASVTLTDRDGAPFATRGALYGGPASLAAIDDDLENAVIAVEDRRFRSHFGVDPIGLGRAVIANIAAGRTVQGGSTITQQLAKNLFLSPERTFKRKIQEAVLAVFLELRFTKDEILTIYLNRVYLGGGAYGVEAAARRYFGKSAATLSLAEAAMIAGLLKAPSRYAPTNDLKRARARAGVVLEAMADVGFIDTAEAEAARKAPAALARAAEDKTGAYFADWILAQLPDITNAPSDDIVIETTLDMDLQRAAEAAIQAGFKGAEGDLARAQAALVAIDARTGAVRAMVGGRSFAKSQFNRAAQALRQPGSAFKPFVYATAFEAGLGPETRMRDSELIFGDWRPRNWDGRYRGEISLREALVHSVNTVAVKTSETAGRRQVAEMARRLGVVSDIAEGPAMALGASEATVLEMTGAYAAFANGGRVVAPHGVSRLMLKAGPTIADWGARAGRPALDPYVAGAVSEMLAEVVSRGTGKNARLASHPVAGKTGTSEGNRDGWFIGYNADLVVGVWVGRDDNEPVKGLSGGGAPARIWKRFMTTALDGVPARPLPGVGAPRASRPVATAPAPRPPEPAPTPGRIEPRGDPGFFERVLGVLSDDPAPAPAPEPSRSAYPNGREDSR